MKRRTNRITTFVATISSKGQVFLPAPVRERLGLTRGMQMTITVHDDNGDAITLEPSRPRPIRELRGSVKCAGAALDYLQQERKRDREMSRVFVSLPQHKP